MKKPQVRTKKYLDWVEVRPYLQKKHPELKLEKAIGLLAEYGDFCNGCFKTIETIDADYEPAIEDLAAALAEEFPEAMDEDGAVELYIWW